MASPYLGQIMLFGGNYAPKGWHFCDGSLLPINQNTALFAVIGTLYGGNGSTNFALPDLRSRVAVGMGQGTGLSAYTIGQTLGQEQVQLNTSQMPTHSHLVNVDATGGTATSPSGGNLAEVMTGRPAVAASAFTTGTPTAPAQLNSSTIASQGGGSAHENRQPSVAMNYIIALQGLYPSRN